MKILIAPLIAALSLSASAAGSDGAVKRASATIDSASLMRHMTVLASDEFEGRNLGGKGEALTIDYLQQQFSKLGLKPGNPDGSWVQKVPLVGVTSTPSFTYSGGGKTTTLAFPEDFVARTWKLEPQVEVAAELVFVGYGIQAPEYKWDDYKGVDVRGKILVMLINDPPIPDASHPGQLDPAVFGGKSMTYYGRWTYKYEMAARLGAAGAMIIHETKQAAYPWAVVRTGGATEGFIIKPDGDDPNNPAVPGWIHLDAAKAMLKAAGQDFDQLKAAAMMRNFKPVPLGLTGKLSVQNTWRPLDSNNVVAMIDGSDPKLKNEYVIYSAHWDHFGIDDKLPGPRNKQIYHGAQDNASGVAALLELAEAYKALPQAPKRSIVFLVPTAEERGLMGSYYYASHPLYPLAQTRININMDMMNVLGRTRDIAVSGYGKSNTDEWVQRVAKSQGRKAHAADAEGGLYFRSDHFPFAKKGVPVLFTETGSDFVGQPANFKQEKQHEYETQIYHKVVDEVNPAWDLAGAVQDTQLLFQVGYDVAQGKYTPSWTKGAEFFNAHKALMKK
jgi:Zn-dependent M28 family amino/carboxypeptidase